MQIKIRRLDGKCQYSMLEYKPYILWDPDEETTLDALIQDIINDLCDRNKDYFVFDCEITGLDRYCIEQIT